MGNLFLFYLKRSSKPLYEEVSSDHQISKYMDPGVTYDMLYFNASKWFPQSSSILPEKTTKTINLLKKIDKDSEIISPAEQVRLVKLMKKDETVGIERLSKLPKKESKTQKLKKMREERKKTIGSEWYHLKRPIMNDELKRELAVMRLEKYASPGIFQKRGATGGDQDYFEIGSIVNNPVTFYTDREYSSIDGIKSKSKLGFVDNLLQDQEFKKFSKRKFRELHLKQTENLKRIKLSKGIRK